MRTFMSCEISFCPHYSSDLIRHQCLLFLRKKYGTGVLYAIRSFPLKPPGHYLLFYVRTVCPVSTTYRKVASLFERLPPLGCLPPFKARESITKTTSLISFEDQFFLAYYCWIHTHLGKICYNLFAPLRLLQRRLFPMILE